MQSNIGVQTAIVLCSALAMGGMSFVGHSQAQKSSYNPSLMPSLNVVASALLLTMLISQNSEHTVDNFHWVTGAVVLALLLGCNYLSSDNVSSLRVVIRSKDASNVSIQDAWESQVSRVDSRMYFGENEQYRKAMASQLTGEIKEATQEGDSIVVNVQYDSALEEGDDSSHLPIVKYMEQVLGDNYVIHSEINKPNGVSIGLAVAVVINFVMDGLLAGNEIDYASANKGFFQFGYMKLNNIFGFIFDNMILMLILGYQFARSSMSRMKQLVVIVCILLSFVVSMFLGMFTKISSSFDSTIAETIVFVVIAYTVFVELLPDTMQFEDYYGREIDIDNKEDPYMMTQSSVYMQNYKKAFMPVLLFGVFFVYKGVSRYLE